MELQHISQAVQKHTPQDIKNYSIISQEEQAIVKAFEGKRIRDVDQMTLVAKLIKVMNMIGCPPVSKEQMGELENMVRKHYGIYTIDEFILAFEMNSTHKLSEKIEHYNVFSFDYVSSVMYLYTKKANEVRKFEKEPEEEKEPVESDPIDIVETYFQYWKGLKPDERDFERIHIGNRIFDAIQESGLHTWTKEDGENVRKKLDELINFKTSKMNMLAANEYRKQLKDPDFKKTLGRKVAVALWFNEQINKTTLK